MPDNISQTADGQDCIMYVGETPWHKKGKKLDAPATAEQAIVAAGQNWQVDTLPFEYKLPSGVHLPSNERRVVVRGDTHAVLGVVTDRYKPIQNREAFGFFDTVVGSGQAIYHTAGALGAGERIWMLAKLPQDIVVGATDQKIQRYMLLTNTHDGTAALRMFFTPVCVVCQNTLNVALSGGVQKGVYIRHAGDLPSKVNAAQQALGLAVRYYDDLGGLVNRLASVQINSQQLKSYFETLMPDNPNTQRHTRTANIRTELVKKFETGMGNQMPGVRGTWWAAVNAVTEFADHTRTTRGRTEEERTDNRLYSIWFGSGAHLKGEAWELALQMSGSGVN